MPVIAARSPVDAFDCAIEAVRIATAVYDAGDAADRWLYRQRGRAVEGAGHATATSRSRSSFLTTCPKAASSPMAAMHKLARPWVKPGTPGLLHRIGGIEKEVDTGHINYVARQPSGDDRHPQGQGRRHRATHSRTGGDAGQGGRRSSRLSAGARPLARSIRPCAERAPRARTSATSTSATSGRCRRIWASCCKSYDKVIVPEMNTGQLKTVLRDQFLVDAKPLNKVTGQPFRIAEIEAAIERAIA